jgi:AcrR family transcriptional regulator
MANTAGTPRRGRGRRPAAQVREQVLTTAAELLFDGGMKAVTFERIAAAAGSSKTTLYKWWPSAGALAAEAYFRRVEPALSFPDTGDIERDLKSQLHAFVELITRGGGGDVIAELVGASQGDAALSAALSETYSLPRRTLAVEAMERAQSRGQLRRDVDLSMIVDQLWGACYHRLLLPGEPITPDFADALVENALYGAAATPRHSATSSSRE